MNCTDVAAILDGHALTRLSAADRCALDEHVTGCEPCAFALHARSAMAALRVPATPADLLDRVLRAVSTRRAEAPRRMRARIVIVGAVLTAGAALAAITAVRLLGRDGQPATTVVDGASESAQGSSSPSSSLAPGTTAASARVATSVAVEDIEAEYFIALRSPPVYPREALERKLEGDVTVEFAIDERGAVKDAHAVRSSDPLFEPSAIAAISQWKYLPRIRAGKRVAVGRVQTVIRFQLVKPPAPPAGVKRGDDNTAPTPPSANAADFATFESWLSKAWERSAADDLRGAELALDELRATYALDDSQTNRVWTFYGYIYTRYTDYGRAIDAYERAVATKTAFWPEQWTSLASLYFARHQYDKALRTLLAFKQRSPSGRISDEATAMIEKLRALGVTEETL